MTLYDELVAAEIPVANHESDLYFQASPKALDILDEYPAEKEIASCFTNKAAPHIGEQWVSVPFAYIPWWEAKRKKS